MPEETLHPEKLVLDLDEETRNFDISKYEDFILALCNGREYQIEATRKIIKLFLSGNYQDTKSLVKENYQKKAALQDFYEEVEQLTDQLQFPDKLTDTIDFATGTGKSYVLYGVAQIMLSEGVVDKVLLLCPSLTIKEELQEKFKDLSSSDFLKESLPADAKYKNPRIIDSSETIKKQDICIDNIHKAYDHVSSSIEHSLKNDNDETLVLNDEAHHLLNPTSHASRNDSQNMREWEKFLKNENYNFNYILNSTGTPYKGDSYFKDVIFRYSITEAIEDGYVKKVDYLEKDESKNWDEKLQAIYNNHIENKENYPEAQKHITLFVTDKINRTDEIANDIRDFLVDKKEISEEKAEEKVIPVTSSSDHEKYLEILETVDEPENPVEWVVSVSMLTEGWDVDNIFQIVPHDKRAFNSKLLISQVLGRGLRVPPEYEDNDKEKPKVRIYNHESWSEKIDNLVKQVAEISKLVTSQVMEGHSEYNFTLFQMDQKKKLGGKKEAPAEEKVELPDSLGFKSESDLRKQIYTEPDTGDKIARETKVEMERHTKEKAVNDIYNSIGLADRAHGTSFAEKADRDYIRNLVEKELEEIGEETVTKENLQRAKKSFNVIFRKVTGYRTTIKAAYKKPQEVSTADMPKSNISINELKSGNRAIMYSEESMKNCSKKKKQNLKEAVREIKGKYNLEIKEELNKTPVNLTILSFSNEIEFAKRLKEEKNMEQITAWVKSRDKGFYSIPYIYRPGTHSLQKYFNPDFIIKKNNNIIIVEIKSDEDTSAKNQVKLDYAGKYFDKLNGEIKEQNYYFYFLSPEDYTSFFEKVIRKGEFKFRGELHADLLKENKNS